jgi:hypothetical protein
MDRLEAGCRQRCRPGWRRGGHLAPGCPLDLGRPGLRKRHRALALRSDRGVEGQEGPEGQAFESPLRRGQRTAVPALSSGTLMLRPRCRQRKRIIVGPLSQPRGEVGRAEQKQAGKRGLAAVPGTGWRWPTPAWAGGLSHCPYRPTSSTTRTVRAPPRPGKRTDESNRGQRLAGCRGADLRTYWLRTRDVDRRGALHTECGAVERREGARHLAEWRSRALPCPKFGGAQTLRGRGVTSPSSGVSRPMPRARV